MTLIAAIGCDDPPPQRTSKPIATEREVPAPAESGFAARLAFEVPELWMRLPAAPMRDLNFRAGEGSQAYLTYLEGGGGGAKANIDRWRGQFGLAGISDAEFAALPRVPLCGRPGVRFDAQGTMSQMGGREPMPDQAMVGIFAEFPAFAVSWKLTGPREVVAEETPRFLEFAASLAVKGMEGDAAAPVAPEASGKTTPARAFDPAKVRYAVPEGWKVGSGSSMRLVTLDAPGGAQCWVTPLGGSAGGIEANLNRWRGEVGKPSLGAEEIVKLPTLRVLGVDSPWLDEEGEYKGMGGPQGLKQARVFALACVLPDVLVTVKMVGPPDVMAREKSAFEAFCRSLEVGP